MSKVFLFGIDGAPPELIFDKWLDDLPNIKKIIKKGSYAKMESAIPPSTIVAWNSMISGRDTSEIGVFNYTYKTPKGISRLVNSNNIKCDLIWDILSKKNKKSIALYVPLSYPVKPINGLMVSGFLTPDLNLNSVSNNILLDKIKNLENPDLFFDVAVGLANHKALPIKTLINNTYKMTKMQIQLLKDLIKNEEWDFFMTVMIGTDRLQHMLWHHFDEHHRKYIPNSQYKNALKDYYIYLDKKLGEILQLIDEDTVVIVASDHGMIRQNGKININNWLINEGYLVLKENVDITERKRFDLNFVDMEKSIAYGGGAYNARIYINKNKVKENYKKILNEITLKLKQIPDDVGNKLETYVYSTKELYKDSSSEDCPDLIVYFDNLRWASNPDLGQEGLYSWRTAVGADSAGHSRRGCFIISGNKIKKQASLQQIDIKMVAPTILKLLNVNIPNNLKVQPIDVLGSKEQK